MSESQGVGAMMEEQIITKLNELKTEFDAGQKVLAELEFKQTNVRNTMLRISGAMQVLEELLASETEQVRGGNGEDKTTTEPLDAVAMSAQ